MKKIQKNKISLAVIIIKKNLTLIFFIVIFIFLYFLFFFYFIILTSKSIVHFVIFIGFAIVIIGFFIFIDFNHNENIDLSINLKFLSESSIKVILTILMCLSLFIQPISSPRTIILWKKVGIFNYIRAIIFILGCAFLPGASIFNIFLHSTKLEEKFKVEPLLIKITLYPRID